MKHSRKQVLHFASFLLPTIDSFVQQVERGEEFQFDVCDAFQMTDDRWILSCYGLLSLLKSSIHYIHLVYYVQIFVSIYRIDLDHFWIAECLFLIWNTLNDPLFGWISDRYISSVHHRLDYLSICTPLLCLSSLLFWYPWMELTSAVLGLQLLVSLCLYDTFLTIIDLNCNSLLIDIPNCRRERLSSASAIGNALGRSRPCRRSTDTHHRLF